MSGVTQVWVGPVQKSLTVIVKSSFEESQKPLEIESEKVLGSVVSTKGW